jgi:outer membrane protein assembly factor BamD
MIRIIYIIFISVVLASCQSNKKEEVAIIAPEKLYNEGLDLLSKKNFEEAADKFDLIYFQHPGNDITPYAELMEAYSLYLARKYQDSVDVIDNYLMIHPAHKDADYAYYLKGLAYYMQISDVQHDQGKSEVAKNIFEELKLRFPNTKYALDASIKLDLIYDHLAGKEMQVGRYYLNRANPIGAANRFKFVISKYQTSTHTPEALFRLVECFKILGLDAEAEKYAAVLHHNYKESKWFEYAFKLLKKGAE